MSMNKLNIGVIGAGSISEMHFESYAKQVNANYMRCAILIAKELRIKQQNITWSTFTRTIMNCSLIQT